MGDVAGFEKKKHEHNFGDDDLKIILA